MGSSLRKRYIRNLVKEPSCSSQCRKVKCFHVTIPSFANRSLAAPTVHSLLRFVFRALFLPLLNLFFVRMWKVIALNTTIRQRYPRCFLPHEDVFFRQWNMFRTHINRTHGYTCNLRHHFIHHHHWRSASLTKSSFSYITAYPQVRCTMPLYLFRRDIEERYATASRGFSALLTIAYGAFPSLARKTIANFTTRTAPFNRP